VGACFRLALPAYAEPAPHAAPVPAQSDRRALEHRALIVDDEVPIRRLLTRLLLRRGFDVSEADSGEAALAMAEQARFSIVLCDVRMPGMSGTDLYRELTAKDPKLAGGFIFITGDRSLVSVDDAFRDVPLLEKPFTSADLNLVLDRIGIGGVLVEGSSLSTA
jgi:DNA-binding NtrC family response regulator